MIIKLQNCDLEISKEIYSVFQASYAVEAKLLQVKDFPPLKRPIESLLKSSHDFYGFFESDELAGVIEVELTDTHTDIHSLVVKPTFFRRGIGKRLMLYVLDQFDSTLFVVETGAKNTPAIELYKMLGFKEVKQWDTDFGVRKVLFERRI